MTDCERGCEDLWVMNLAQLIFGWCREADVNGVVSARPYPSHPHHRDCHTFNLVAGRISGVLFWVTVWFVTGGFLDAHAGSDRPNIIVVVCDDMGFSDLGCYGGEIATPNLDKLAANGLRFNDFHNNSKCTETRATLLTGLWHQQTKRLKTKNHVTVAEVLKSAGYSTAMVGKWHVAGHPIDRGFDRYFGFLSGCINFFNGKEWNTKINNMNLGKEEWIAGDGFYSTDAFTQYARRFINQMTREKPDSPFFLYLAHNAPHFPLQAPKENIRKYRGKYSDGWDKLRESRYKKMQELGIIDNKWPLSPRDPKVESWDLLTPEEKAFMEPMMEVYAAMVDRLDENMGELVNFLEKKKLLENTLILFMSDNGACPYERVKSETLIPGPEESDIAYDARWANACNTPLRLYKQYAHQGGTLTPMIAHWPAAIQSPGRITSWNGHIVDIMPTVVELAGADYPETFQGNPVLPMEGESMKEVLTGTNPRPRSLPIFWEFTSHHGVRFKDWKLVAEKSKDWELYHILNDRSETRDLSDESPNLVSLLSSLYGDWAAKVGAVTHEAATKKKPHAQSQLFDLKSVLNKESE